LGLGRQANQPKIDQISGLGPTNAPNLDRA
jgi:hypothetical protein